MRVTQTTVTRNLVNDISKNNRNLIELQHQLSSGKAIENASDDPVKFSIVNRYRQTIRKNELYIKNIVDAQGWVKMNESVVKDLYEKVLNVKEIALRASDLSLSADDRKVLSNQVNGTINEVVELLNTKYLGKYLFGGTKTIETIPFNYNGSKVIYNGDAGEIKRRIAENIEVTVNISGETFQSLGLVDSLIELRDALNNNDLDSIKNLLDKIDGISQGLLSLNAKIGALGNQLTMAKNRLETTNANISSFISELEDADLVQVIAKYNAEELAYKAALQATAKTFNLTILDYL